MTSSNYSADYFSRKLKNALSSYPGYSDSNDISWCCVSVGIRFAISSDNLLTSHIPVDCLKEHHQPVLVQRRKRGNTVWQNFLIFRSATIYRRLYETVKIVVHVQLDVASNGGRWWMWRALRIEWPTPTIQMEVAVCGCKLMSCVCLTSKSKTH